MVANSKKYVCMYICTYNRIKFKLGHKQNINNGLENSPQEGLAITEYGTGAARHAVPSTTERKKKKKEKKKKRKKLGDDAKANCAPQ